MTCPLGPTGPQGSRPASSSRSQATPLSSCLNSAAPGVATSPYSVSPKPRRLRPTRADPLPRSDSSTSWIGRRLHELQSVPDRVRAVEPLKPGKAAVPHDCDATALQAPRQSRKVTDEDPGMRLCARVEVSLDAEMDLHGAGPEPATTTAGKLRRLVDFLAAQDPRPEGSTGFLGAGRDAELNVVKSAQMGHPGSLCPGVVTRSHPRSGRRLRDVHELINPAKEGPAHAPTTPPRPLPWPFVPFQNTLAEERPSNRPGRVVPPLECIAGEHLPAALPAAAPSECTAPE